MDAFQKQQKQHQTHHQTSSQPPCHIYVNESNSEDLYQKAFSDTPCTLILDGKYGITRSLPPSIRMKAISDPETIDSPAQHTFTDVSLEPAASPDAEKMLLTRSSQGFNQNGGWVEPAAVLVIATSVKDEPVTLPDHIAGSGIGITLENHSVHQSGCRHTSIETTSTHKRTVLWSHDQVNELCTQEHYQSATDEMRTEPRQCPVNQGRGRCGAAKKQVQKKADTYSPPEYVLSQAREGATSLAAAGAGGGGDKRDNSRHNQFLEQLQKIKSLYLKARGQGAKGEAKRALKQNWGRVPESFKAPIRSFLDDEFPGDLSFSNTLRRC